MDSPHQTPRDPAPSKLIGREAELHSLRRRDIKATVLVGESGIGKSRLLAEAALELAPASVFTVACRPNPHLPSHRPLFALVTALCQRHTLREGLAGEIADLPESDRFGRVLEAIHVASAHNITLQIDDLQWADPRVADAVVYCIERLQDSAVKWHITARPGRQLIESAMQALRRSEAVEILTLHPLNIDQTRALMVVHGLPNPEEALVRRLHRNSGGIPMYAEMMLKGQVTALAQTFNADLHDLVASLSDLAREIAQWMAVANEPLSAERLGAFLGQDIVAVNRALEEIHRRGLIEIRDGAVVFRHDSMREACYRDTDISIVRHHHRILASVAFTREARAAHLERAGLMLEAAHEHILLGWDSLAHSSPKEATASFTRAMPWLPLASASLWEAQAGQAIARCASGDCAEAIGEFETLWGRLDASDPSLRAVVRGRFATTLWESSRNPSLAQPFLTSAIELSRKDAPGALSSLLAALGSAYERKGDLDDAQRVLEAALLKCAESADIHSSILARRTLGVVRARKGDSAGAMRLIEEAFNDADGLGIGDLVAKCCATMCYVCDMSSDTATYEYWCRRGLATPWVKSSVDQAALMSNLAYVTLDAGRLREGIGIMISVLKMLPASHPFTIQTMCGLATTYVVVGESAAAAAMIARLKSSTLPAHWKAAAQFSAAFVDEVEGRVDEALAGYARCVPADIPITEAYHARALMHWVRAACRAERLEEAAAPLARLLALDATDWRVVAMLAKSAQGYYDVALGNIEAGCATLTQAVAMTGDMPHKTDMEMTMAIARGDGRLLRQALAAFETMGDIKHAQYARLKARACGMRLPQTAVHGHPTLSDREISVTMHIAAGFTNKEIAQALSVSTRTVEFHVRNILAKCMLRSRLDIALRVADGSLFNNQSTAESLPDARARTIAARR